MKQLIWKFKIDLHKMTNNIFQVDLPQTAEVLSVAAIGDEIFVWVKFDAKAQYLDFVPRFFEVFGTGHEIHCDMGIDRKFIGTALMYGKFIGTALMYGGGLVWHVFERLD
jgi:hypothetical protein